MSIIGLGYKGVVRPWLFYRSRRDPEIAHEWALNQLECMGKSARQMSLARHLLTYRHPMLEQELLGHSFPTPLGLAAGFDKNARVAHVLPSFGWGFVTIGAVLRHHQPGNPRKPEPRMWRSLKLKALGNWLGFNSEGTSIAQDNLTFNSPSTRVPRVLNIGKNKEVSEQQALQDYSHVFRTLWSLVDAGEANPSSPNTPGLRDFQKRDVLRSLLLELQAVNKEQSRIHNLPEKPLGVKISPDESDEALHDIVDVAVELGIQFLTLTNTTVSREGLNGWNIPPDRGGVSGPPLVYRARHTLKEVHRELQHKGVREKFVLIGAGGISNATDVMYRLFDGADICEALTVWPFEGPDWPARTSRDLVRLLRRSGFANVRAAVGAAG
mgnify:CR=1 FL=1